MSNTNNIIDNIKEASKNARQIYFLYIGILAYCAFTVVSTTDRQIILNAKVNLPIININVSLNGFFILCPLIAISIFVYFQLYLQILRGLITKLSDSNANNKKEHLYPWMLNVIDDPTVGFIGKLQKTFVSFSLWWSLPIVMSLFSLWYVKKHDPIWSYVLGAMPILGTTASIYFWFHFKINKEGYKFKNKTDHILNFIKINASKIALAIIIVSYETFLFCVFIPTANELGGDSKLKKLFCVDLSYQKLITEQNPIYDGLYWLDIKGVHLEGANLEASVLKLANLSKANLQEANLSSANLEHANMSNAKLHKANLSNANLEHANMSSAKLLGANLSNTKLQEANLSWSYLQGALLSNAKLQKANLLQANLQNANFFKANLGGTNFKGANLKGAYLRGANLEGAEGLTVDQLSKVSTLLNAKLDSNLELELKKKYPELFQIPMYSPY